jgi:hypothetical protein
MGFIITNTILMRIAQLVLAGIKSSNYFVAGSDKPLRDEDGHLVVDPNRKKVLLVEGDEVKEYSIKTADLNESVAKIGKVVNCVFEKIEGFNDGEEFLYSIG